MSHQTADQYRASRAKVVDDFVRQAEADKAALIANPGDYNITDAIALVGVDAAVFLFLAGALAEKPAS